LSVFSIILVVAGLDSNRGQQQTTFCPLLFFGLIGGRQETMPFAGWSRIGFSPHSPDEAPILSAVAVVLG
jgi:hypothetical protein